LQLFWRESRAVINAHTTGRHIQPVRYFAVYTVHNFLEAPEVARLGLVYRHLGKVIAEAKVLDVVVDARSVFAFGQAVNLAAAVSKEVDELLNAGSFPKVAIPKTLKVSGVRTPETAPMQRQE
jgi:hypothetical protein